MSSPSTHSAGRDRAEILPTVASLRDRLDPVRAQGRDVVLVPTMGALHEGHLSLVDRARSLDGLRQPFVLVSVFVNPLQFGPGEDFDVYPRDLEGDRAMLAARGSDAVFAPSVGEMVGPDTLTRVTMEGLTDCLCGPRRPGHFDGVLTVVARLFLVVRPSAAVFGQKDGQQALVIRRMVQDLGFPVRLVLGPTVREDDGLALSSRNAYLSAADRARAASLYAALRAVEESLREGERDVTALEGIGRRVLEDAGVDEVEYLELRTVPDLEHPSVVRGRVMIATAARVSGARLIDNLVLDVDRKGVREAMLF
jgi:pantoate--beta-alanine ligase